MRYLIVFLSLSACAPISGGATFAELYEPVCFARETSVYVLANDRAALVAIAQNNATAKVMC